MKTFLVLLIMLVSSSTMAKKMSCDSEDAKNFFSALRKVEFKMGDMKTRKVIGPIEVGYLSYIIRTDAGQSLDCLNDNLWNEMRKNIDKADKILIKRKPVRRGKALTIARGFRNTLDKILAKISRDF